MDVMATIVMLFLVLVVLVSFVRLFTKKDKLRRLVIMIVCLVFLVSIPVIGHTQWNRDMELAWIINHITQDSGNYLNDPGAVKELMSTPKPLKYR